jgi:hypothetical protein
MIIFRALIYFVQHFETREERSMTEAWQISGTFKNEIFITGNNWQMGSIDS